MSSVDKHVRAVVAALLVWLSAAPLVASAPPVDPLDRWTLISFPAGNSFTSGGGAALRNGLGPDNRQHFYASTNAMANSALDWTDVLATSGIGTYAGGLFFVSGRDHGFSVAVSRDGYYWTNCHVQPYFIDQVTRVRRGFLGRGVPYPAAPYQEVLYQSSDGCQWQPSSLPYLTYSGLQLAVFGNGILLGTIYSGSKQTTDIYVSEDMTNWAVTTNALAGAYGYGVTFGHGKFMAIHTEYQAGQSYGVLHRSGGGRDWSEKVTFGPLPAGAGPWGVIYANRTYLAFGYDRHVYSSVDGSHWTQHDTGFPYTMSDFELAGFWSGRYFLVPLTGANRMDLLLSDATASAIDRARMLPDLCRRLPDGAMLLTVEAPYGREVTVEASSDLATWSAIATDPCDTGEFEVYDEGAKAVGHRFYRAWQAGP